MTKVFLTMLLIFSSILTFGQQKIENTLSPEHQNIVGTKVSLVAPAGFENAVNFLGLQQTESGSSIMVVNIPGPYSLVAATMTKEKLQGKGIEVEKIEKRTINGLPASLIIGTQVAQGIPYAKFSLVFGSDEETIIVNGACPKMLKEIGKTVKTAILTVYYDADMEIDPFEALDYTIDVTGTPLKFAESMSMALFFTTDGKFPSTAKVKSTLIVTKSFSEVTTEDKKLFAINRLKQSPIIVDEIESTNEITIDGISGYEIFAKGKHKESGEVENLYQVLLFSDKLYYVFMGTSEDLSAERMVEMQKAVATFKRK